MEPMAPADVEGLRVCEAHAYILRDGLEENVLENVDLVEVEGDAAKLLNIFGEQVIVKARIKKRPNRAQASFLAIIRFLLI